MQRQVTDIAAALVKASPASIDSILQGALRDAGQRLQGDRCTLYLFDPDSGVLSISHSWVADNVAALPLEGLGSVPGDKLFPACLQHLMAAKTLVIRDVLEPDPVFQSDANRLAKLGVRSLILVPMFAGELPLGLIGVDRADQPGLWTERQQLFLEQVGAFMTQSLLRIKAERAVARAEARHQALTRYNQSTLYELSLDGRYLYIAPTVEAAVGYRPRDLLGKRFDCLLPPEDARRVEREFSTAIRDPQAVPVHEYRVRHKNGQLVWHRSVVAPVRDQTGRVTSLVCNALDVTGLKNAEAQLQCEADLTALLVRLASEYINLPVDRLDPAIDHSLDELARFVGADRAYVFAYDHVAQTATNTHEWCADGVSSHREDLRALPMAQLQDFLQPHLVGELVQIADVAAYPHQPLRELLQFQGICSLIAVPMMDGSDCVGFVGFDSVRQKRAFSSGEIHLLRVFAQMLVNMKIRSRVQQQLEREQHRLNDIIDGTDAGTWEWDQQTQEMLFNARFARMMGHDSTATLPTDSRDWMSHVHPEDFESSIQALVGHLKGETANLEVELRLRHAQGHWVWLSLRGRVAAREDNGRARLISGIAIDISDKKKAEADLRLAASVFTHSHEGILITDLEGRIIDVNESFSRISGYTREEVLGKNPRILNSGRQSPAFYQDMWRALEQSGYWTGEVWNRRRDGVEYAQRLTISTVRDSHGRGVQYVGLLSDITEQKHYQQNLERLAHFDSLTSLPNRVLMGERIRQAMTLCRRHGQLMALAYMDIDHFKLINESCGQHVGDKVLQAVAAGLERVVREGDMVARPGGDEFVVLLTHLEGSHDLDQALDSLLAAVAQPLKIGRLSFDLKLSVGVTTYPQRTELEADQLLRQADQAMYEAKRVGRNGVRYFDAELEQVQRRRQEGLQRLRQAFEQREFVLHYQPKVNLRTGSLAGVEALIRWQHPQRGLLAPSEFLPLVDGDELGHQLGNWVLATALDDLLHWHTLGLDIAVAVNVSGTALLRGDFVESLRRELVARPAVDPSKVILEIVETSMLEDIDQANERTRACAELGVRFALDDFGTGFSSLTHLKHLPIRQLKVDISFVRDMLKDPDDLAIIEGIIRLGQAFDMEVLAEGVETDDHVNALLNMGCELAQGYLFARPMSASALAEWVRNWSVPANWAKVPRLDQAGLPLLFAEAESMARLAELEARLASPDSVRPRNAPRSDRSRFRRWLNGHRNDTGCALLLSLLSQVDDADAEVQRLLRVGELKVAAEQFETLQTLTMQLLTELRRRRTLPAPVHSKSE